MSLINVPSKKFKNAKFGATSLLTNQRARSPNFSKEQSGESVHKLSKESMGEESTQTVQRTNKTKIFLKNKFWMNVTLTSTALGAPFTTSQTTTEVVNVTTAKGETNALRYRRTKFTCN